ncbi:MAG: type IV toxin-antitoxin system AbiEi family antitoxin domain-containing protein, partial [Acidimicrobiia bacterium]
MNVVSHLYGAKVLTLQKIAELQQRQFGVISREQLLASGATRRWIERKVQQGELVRVLRSVFRLAGSPDTFESKLMAAFLFVGGGAAVSHGSAGSLMGLIKPEASSPIHISLPKSGRRSAEGIVVHNVRDLEPMDVVMFKNVLPVTSATRTLIDLAATSDLESLELMLDEALLRGWTKLVRLKWRLNTIGHGREGIAFLRELVAEREGRPLAQSQLETRFLRLIKNARLP